MLAIAALGFCAAQAQVTLEGTKLTDNVSFTLKGGAVSPFQHYAFFKNARGMVPNSVSSSPQSLVSVWKVNGL